MRPASHPLAALTLAVLSTTVPTLAQSADPKPSDTTALRIRFGMKDTEPTDWSGSVSLTGPGKLDAIRGWRWAAGDSADDSEFTVSTHRPPAQNAAQRRRVQAGARLPVAENGIVLSLSGVSPETKLSLKTKPGSADISLADVPLGKPTTALDGNMTIERVPAFTELAATVADEDYPASARAKDGTLYVAYLAFTRGKDFTGPRERPATPDTPPNTGPNAVGAIRKITKPEDLDYLAQPAGGEQLFLRARKPDGTWTAPVPVTDGKHELYRPAIAVDGHGKVWVVYSAHLNADKNLDHGNWELMARSFDANTANGSSVINLSNTDGPDFMPAAATDSAGNVTVAWVGGRTTNYNIFTATQSAPDKFSAAKRLTDAKNANEWEPSVAADKDGHLAIAFDTYAKGDYDVHVSLRNSSGSFDKPQVVAGSLAFEVRPSISYDKTGKLWIAYETSGDMWGKDFGPLKRAGIPIYQNRRGLAVRVLDSAGKWFEPPDVMDALPDYSPNRRPRANATADAKVNFNAPQAPAGPAGAIAPCYPRLATADDGSVYLTFRGRPGGPWRTPVGSNWFHYVTRLAGDAWSEAAWIPRSSGTLDTRPTLAVTDSTLTVIYPGDGRGEINPPKPGESPTTATAAVDLGASDDDADAAAASAAAANRKPAANANAATPELIQPARPARGARRAAGIGNVNADLFTATLTPSDFTAPARGGRLSDHLKPIDAPKSDQPIADTPAERAAIAAMRDYRVNLNGESLRIWRGEFHRHTEFSFDGANDGGLLDLWRYAVDAADMDWIGDGDHDYGGGREYSWWTTQKAVTLFTLPGRFVPMFCYERSVSYPEGHRNCMFAVRGIRSLPRLPISDPNVFAPAPDTQLLYMYLKHFNGVCAPHTSATDMGTDWRNYDPEVEPFVEIYQGDRNSYERPDAPRTAVTEAKLKQSTPERESMGGWRPKGFVNLALKMGRRYAFESSSDHLSTHLSYCNVLVTEPTRENILDAVKKRRTYAATDNIIADVRCKVGDTEKFMGEEFTTTEAPTLNIRIIGAKKIAKLTIIKDDEEVHTATPNEQDVKMTWTDPHPTPGKVSYYYVRGEQVKDREDVTSGELVWASPMWITYQPK